MIHFFGFLFKKFRNTMKTVQSIFPYFSFLIFVTACNKLVVTGGNVEIPEVLLSQHVEDEVLSLHFMSGCYTGKICKNGPEDYNHMRVVLQEDSTYDLYCETLYGNKKTERMRGSYSFSQDTLTLYTAQDNQKFVIKDNELLYVGYSLELGDEVVDESNILYKN